MSKTKTGSNAIFTGPQKGLTVIGEHCYAYSGIGSPSSTTDYTGLDFTTGKQYVKGRVYFSIDNDDLASGEQIGWKLMMNNQQVTMSRVEASATDIIDSALAPYFDIIIPPLTNLQAIAFTNASGVNCSIVFTGRVYG